MARPTTVTINQQALQYNLQRARDFAPQSKVLAMVKANAYGHQLPIVAKALAAADGFGVSCIEEAMQVYDAVPNKKIVLMEGVFASDEFAMVEQLQLDIVVHNHEQIALLEKNKCSTPLTVWLKFDTGMNRLGFDLSELSDVWQRLQACSTVKAIQLMTHFPQAFDPQHPQTEQQISAFFKHTQQITAEKSLANSAAVINNANSHADWIRPGIMLYGVSPFDNSVASDHQLQAVMNLQSEIIAIKHCRKGEGIGYGGTWICPEDMPIAVVAIGYGDGYPRHAENGTPILVNGVRTQLVGRVSMDMLTVDLRSIVNPKIGDSVTLWGDGLPVEEIARCSRTIPYELLTSVTTRVRVV